MSAASTTAAPKSDGISGIAKRARANLQTYAILLALILIWIFFWWRTDGAFLAPQNFSNLFHVDESHGHIVSVAIRHRRREGGRM